MADHKKADIQSLLERTLTTYEYEGVQLVNVVLKESMDELKTFDVRSDDVWVCTYPKSGTHFAGEIVSLILGNGDPHKLNRLTFMSTIAMVMIDQAINPDNVGGADQQGTPQEMPTPEQMKMTQPKRAIDLIKEAPSPRIIFTHLPFQLLPPKIEKRAKILYVARNPKDVVTSMMTFIEKTIPVPGGFAKLIQDEINGDISYGGWYNHVTGFWEKRNEKNVLFLKYEDMVQDLPGCVKKVVELLECNLTDEVFDKVVAGSEFSGMKKTYDAIEKSSEQGVFLTRAGGQMPFMQKGKIGTWKTRFTVAQNEMFSAWYEDKLGGSDLQFQFE